MSNSVTPPDPVPADGYRTLSPREMAHRAASFTCMHRKGPGVCQGQVYSTLFFDGTGNNQKWIEPNTSGTQQARDKHSNIARLLNAALTEPADGFFPYYIPGVGTPFKEIGDTDTSGNRLGQGAGYMGADRINWGITRIFNAMHMYAIEGQPVLITDDIAKTLVNEISSNRSGYEKQIRIDVLRRWEQKLAAALKRAQRKITSVNVAVFGFSRGAAKARAFANWVSELLKHDAARNYTLAGVPFRLYFMGLFDTVASVGNSNAIPGLDGHMAWADGTQSIPALVEKCVHYVALHEQRASFPLEMVYASDVKQVAYPGMHSDVGGGYLPTEQGKTGQLSQIPLNDMHYEAVKARVPLLSRSEINELPFLKKQFDIPPELIAVYNAYLSENGIGANAAGEDGVRNLIQRHTRQYLQWRQAAPARTDLQYRDFYKRATPDDQKQLAAAQDDLAQQVRDVRPRITPDVGEIAADLMQGGLVRAIWENRPVSAATHELYSAVTERPNIPANVEKLFNDYVHDSRAGFRILGMLEPHGLTGGYLGYRDVFHNGRLEEVAEATVGNVLRSLNKLRMRDRFGARKGHNPSYPESALWD